MKVWYPRSIPRATGLRLEPGWNELPVATAMVLIERGIVTQTEPGAEVEQPKEGSRRYRPWRTEESEEES